MMPSEDRREQLLLAALDILVERGYAETRIVDVAERAGTSPGLVINYFKTRDELLTEALRYWEDDWYATSAARLDGISDATGRLSRLITMTYEMEPGIPGGGWLLWLDLWALAPRSPGVAAARREFDQRWHQVYRDIIVRGQETGEFREVEVDDFVLTLTGLLDGLAVRVALGDYGPSRAHDLAMSFAIGHLAPRASHPAQGAGQSAPPVAGGLGTSHHGNSRS
jgi:AcrR family transcriptional regulator